MSTDFREVILPVDDAQDGQVPLAKTFYVYHDSVGDLPQDDVLIQASKDYDTLVIETVEPNPAFNYTDNVILNGNPSRPLLFALEQDAMDNPRAKIIKLLSQKGMRSVVVEPPVDSKLWALRRKRLLQTEIATNSVINDGVNKKSVDTYNKARRLYIKDGMVPRDEVATEGIINLIGQSARVLSFWGSAHMSIALALSREGIEQIVEVPSYQVLDIEPNAQIVDEFRNGNNVERERFTPWLIADIAGYALRAGLEVQSNSLGQVTEMNGQTIDRTVSMPEDEVDIYLKSADESLEKGSVLVLP